MDASSRLRALVGEMRACAAKASRVAGGAWRGEPAARAELGQALSISAAYMRAGAWCLAIALLLAGAGASIMATPALVLGAVHAMVEARGERRDEAAALRGRLRDAAAEMEGVAFIERFRTLDANRWVFSDGWDNGAFMENDWRSSALSTGPEGLAITMDWNPQGSKKLFASGELQSRESFQYGYFEARMKVPRGDGLVVGLFTYTQPSGRSTWEEIDIEILGRDTRTMEVTYHVHGRSRQTGIDLGFDAADDFHIYAFEWTEDALRWYVDNRLVHEVRGARVADLRRTQRFYLQLWNTAELYRWAGHINPQEAPWVLQVSCVA
ncbi:MAG TPA: family 16 glycosylhydrolase, partial [Terricaulis sp.]|nr:family 16 glycosylhydrolase [Terricaulis sp.]